MLFGERRVLVFGGNLGSSMQLPLIGQIEVIKVCEASFCARRLPDQSI